MITIKTKKEIEIMREGGQILAWVMRELEKLTAPGIITRDLNRAAENLILKHNAKPSFKGYQGFPCALCVCVNEELVHCIPCSRKLKEGDIVSLDLGVFYKSFHTDMAVTLPVGRVSPEARRLIKITKKSLKRGIKKVRPGNTFGDIGNTVQRYVEGQGYGIVRDLCGHGIGRDIHEDPQILNYGKRKTGPEIKSGMTFCIEPMVTAGDWQIKKSKDNFGLQTKDNSLCCHFEHTLAVTDSGCEILTSLE